MKNDKQSGSFSKQNRREFTRKLAVAGAGLPLLGSTLRGQSTATPGRSHISPEMDPFTVNIFSKHLQFLDYREMAKASADAGVDGVDLSVRLRGHVLPQNVERDLPRAAKAVRRAGLDLPMMTTGITDPDDPLTERILKVAADQGIKYYRYGYIRYDWEQGVAKSLDEIRGRMEKLAELNEKYNIHGAYQNHDGDRFGGPVWDIWEAIRDLDPQWTGCQYDIRHAVVEGAHSWTLAFNLLRPHIRCMVIKDFHWEFREGNWRIKNVPVGQGMVNFTEYFKLLAENSISGPISVHIEYPMVPDENMLIKLKTKAAVETIRRDVEAIRNYLPS
jgi:sugar phosphate isomerase/epimerase